MRTDLQAPTLNTAGTAILVGDIDPRTSQARDFLFNGDNKQREVIVNCASVGSYFYDGEGKRVHRTFLASAEEPRPQKRPLGNV